MATPVTRKAPATEDLGWRKPINPSASAGSPRSGTRTRTRGGGRNAREGPGSARSQAGAGSQAASASLHEATGRNATRDVEAKNELSSGPNRHNTLAQLPPPVTVEAATPTAEAFSATTPSPEHSSRRKRSQARNSNRTPSPIQPKTASPVAPIRHSAMSPSASRDKQASKLDRSKDTPPHLLPACDTTPVSEHAKGETRSNLEEKVEIEEEVDAEEKVDTQQQVDTVKEIVTNKQTGTDVQSQVDNLVEHTRAVAINRPTSPSTHIDWAGDEDDSLPDLNDWVNEWGYDTKKQDTLEPGHPGIDVISPILENSLKSLPILSVPESSSAAHLGDSQVSADPNVDLRSRSRSPEKTKSRRGARHKGSKPSGDAEHPQVLPKRETARTAVAKPSLASRISSSDQPTRRAAGDVAPFSTSSSSPAFLQVSKDPETPRPRSGLSASIHAPSPTDDRAGPRTTFSDTPGFVKDTPARVNGAMPRTPRNARDRLARPNSVHAAGGDAFGGAAHSRTQSVPVTPSRQGARAPGAARPVIAGSAISMLAKQLAGSPQRNASPGRT
jgi:hypothetical protein